MNIHDINTFSDFVAYLRSFQSFHGDMTYDCGGVITLLQAILDNLRENEEEATMIIDGYLEPHQKAFLIELAEAANCPDEDE